MFTRPRLVGSTASLLVVFGLVVSGVLIRSVDRWLGETLQVIVVGCLAVAFASIEKFTVVSHKLRPHELRRLSALGLTYGASVVLFTLSVLSGPFFVAVGLCLSMSLLARAVLRFFDQRRAKILRRRSPWWAFGLVALYLLTEVGKTDAVVAASTAGALHGIAHSLRAELCDLKSIVVIRWQLGLGVLVSAFVMLRYESHPIDDLALFPVVSVVTLVVLYLVLGYVATHAARYPTGLSNAFPLLAGLAAAWLLGSHQYTESVSTGEYILVAATCSFALVADWRVKSSRYLPVVIRTKTKSNSAPVSASKQS